MYSDSRFLRSIRGNIAMMFAAVLPALLVCAALAVDYGVWIHQKQELQRIADEAALAAARELYMANATAPQACSAATSSAAQQMVAQGMMSMASAQTMTAAANSPGAMSNTPRGDDDEGDEGADGPSAPGPQATTFGNGYNVATTVDMADGSVRVMVTQTGADYFSRIIMPPPDIAAVAVARVIGGGRICVLALEETEAAAVTVQDTATIQADRCGVFSNSTSADGLTKETSATITAELICSAGGYDGTTARTTPEPVTDCPPISDPLADREPPSVGGCDYTDTRHMVWFRTEVTLMPGVYCGGLILTGPVKVWMEPGIYVMKDGPLITTLWAELRGDNVGIYMTGDKATFSFSIEGVVELTAPEDGPMAGILFFEDRASTPLRRFEIYSDEARVLLGTIYLPNGRFIVGTPKPVADLSAYTAIVARRVELLRNPTLVLNSNYSQTDVPVPAGINRVGGSVVLAR
jgi:Flp pilus assembly protein TadG